MDIPEIVKIERSIFADPWDEQLFTGILDSVDKHLFVEEINGTIAAYIIYEKVIDEGHITNLAVRNEYQGRGMASGMVKYVLDQAHKANIKEMFLEVRDKNEAALKLYFKFGFKVIGRRKGYYPKANEDALVMKLKF
jgi:ribosomal-protein-alanine N-acetyltransferase